MANHCCPEPADIWLFRSQNPGVGGPVFTYTVPANKILIVNAWVALQVSGGQPLDVLRNTEVVATTFMQAGDIVSQVFPTGIVFFAGDTLKIDLTNRNGTSTLYGYLQKA